MPGIPLSSFPGDSVVKNLPANAGDLGSFHRSGRFLGEGNSNSFSVFLPGKSHAWRRLESYSPWGCKRAGHNLVLLLFNNNPSRYIPCIAHFSLKVTP